MENEEELLERELLEVELFCKLSKLFENVAKHNGKQEDKRVTYSLLNEVLLERDNLKTKEIIDKINVYNNKIDLNNSHKINEELVNKFKDDIHSLMEVDDCDEEDSSSVKEIIVIDEKIENHENNQVDKLLEIIDKRIKILESEVMENNKEDEEYTYFCGKTTKGVEPATEQDLKSLFNPNVNQELSEEEQREIEEKNQILQRELSIRSSQKLTREEIDSFIKKIDDKLALLEAEEKALSKNNKEF